MILKRDLHLSFTFLCSAAVYPHLCVRQKSPRFTLCVDFSREPSLSFDPGKLGVLLEITKWFSFDNFAIFSISYLDLVRKYSIKLPFTLPEQDSFFVRICLSALCSVITLNFFQRK